MSLATPSVLQCTACRYVGPPAPRDSERLAHAATVLWSLDVRQRQLDAAQLRLLRSARRGRLGLVLSLIAGALALSPCVACALMSVLLPEPGYGMALSCGAPVFVFALTGAALLAIAFRRRRSLEEACAAEPPELPGQPARCHVCGAPLRAGIDEHVVRCGFCQADNVIDPKVLARLGAKRARAIGDFDAAVRQEASRLRAGMWWMRVAVVGVVLASPVFCLMGSALSMRLGPLYEAPVDRRVEYVLVRGDSERTACMARVHSRYRSGATQLNRLRQPRPERGMLTLPGAARLPTVDATWLVGRTVRPGWGQGTVTRVYRNVLDPHANHAVVQRGERIRRIRVESLCLITPPPAPVLRWAQPSVRGGELLPYGTPHTDARIEAGPEPERVPSVQPEE
jgi:hypothetical protein